MVVVCGSLVSLIASSDRGRHRITDGGFCGFERGGHGPSEGLPDLSHLFCSGSSPSLFAGLGALLGRPSCISISASCCTSRAFAGHPCFLGLEVWASFVVRLRGTLSKAIGAMAPSLCSVPLNHSGLVTTRVWAGPAHISHIIPPI